MKSRFHISKLPPFTWYFLDSGRPRFVLLPHIVLRVGGGVPSEGVHGLAPPLQGPRPHAVSGQQEQASHHHQTCNIQDIADVPTVQVDNVVSNLDFEASFSHVTQNTFEFSLWIFKCLRIL